MTSAEFVEAALRAQRDEMEELFRALEVGQTLCVHEHDLRDGYLTTAAAHTLAAGRICNAAGRRTQYGPMTPEIRATADVSPAA